MPLLAFWGDMTGLLGGAVACTVYLDFTFVQFFDRLRDTVGAWNFYTGMIKSPVFGFIIAAIGCFEGLQVSGSAESVGQLTTRSVVEVDILRHRAGLRCSRSSSCWRACDGLRPLLEGGQIVDHRDGRDVVLKVRGVRTQFGDNVIHDNLDFDMFRGEVVGLVGGSGSGKSVLLRAIIGLNELRRGQDRGVWASIRAACMARPSGRCTSRTGVQFQDGALFSSLTVAENIIVPIREHAEARTKG